MYNTPNIFEKLLKYVFLNDKIYTQDQFVQGLSSYNLYFGSFSNPSVSLKVSEYIETKFNLVSFMS
jgi:hypothetical protein